MERKKWLKKMRTQTESLYDHIAPAYWEKFGLYPDVAHQQYLAKFLARLEPHSFILDAACGAGRYDGAMLEAGHGVLGIDQSGSMLARAREHFPQEQYPKLHLAKVALQEMDFYADFDAVTCIDALEHICPEDWPGILIRFQNALKPGGLLYMTVDATDSEELRESYERSRAMGLPVVIGEIVDRVETGYTQALAMDALDPRAISGQELDRSIYHYYPSMDQVHTWLDQSGFEIKEEGTGDEYIHLLSVKKT